MDILILCGTILASACASLSNAFYGKKGKCNPFLFGACASLIACIFFFCYNKFQFHFDRYTLGLAALFAITYLTCDVCVVYAMKRGSVAMTTMISSFSLLLPTLFSVIYWKESTNWLFYVGLVFVCGALVLSNLPKKEEGENKTQEKRNKLDWIWVILVALVFFANGSCAIIQNFHQKTGGAPFKAEFMILALSIVCITNTIISCVMLKKETVGYLKRASIFGGAYGLFNGVMNLLVMLVASSGIINLSVFYPVLSVGTLALVFTASIIIFKEKFSVVQYVGIALGVVAIVLLQI